MQWMSTRYLINKLEDNPSILDENSLMNNFYITNLNSSAGKFQSVTRARKDALTINSLITNNVNIYKSQIIKAIDSLYIIDSLFATDLNTADSIFLSQKKELLVQNYSNTSQLLDSLVKLAQNIKNQEVDNVISMNNALPETQTYEKNEKIITDIYLQTIAKGIKEFSSTQKATILEIANECPYIGGPAVYLARGLYFSYGDIFICNLRPEVGC